MQATARQKHQGLGDSEPPTNLLGWPIPCSKKSGMAWSVRGKSMVSYLLNKKQDDPPDTWEDRVIVLTYEDAAENEVEETNHSGTLTLRWYEKGFGTPPVNYNQELPAPPSGEKQKGRMRGDRVSLKPKGAIKILDLGQIGFNDATNILKVVDNPSGRSYEFKFLDPCGETTAHYLKQFMDTCLTRDTEKKRATEEATVVAPETDLNWDDLLEEAAHESARGGGATMSGATKSKRRKSSKKRKSAKKRKSTRRKSKKKSFRRH